MKIDYQMMNEIRKAYEKYGKVSPAWLMRKYKFSYEYSKKVCKHLEDNNLVTSDNIYYVMLKNFVYINLAFDKKNPLFAKAYKERLQ